MTSREFDANSSCDEVTTAARLRQLVAVHLVLGLTPVAGILVPANDLRFMPLIWALFSVSYGQLMLLSFWVGMGTSRTMWRLLGALLGSAYVAAAQFLYSILSPDFAAERMSGRIALGQVRLVGVPMHCSGYVTSHRNRCCISVGCSFMRLSDDSEADGSGRRRQSLSERCW